jgi:hypothetical protein
VIPAESESVRARLTFGLDTRKALLNIIQWLETLEPGNDESRGYVFLWHVALATIAWDVSEAALELGANGSVRAARMLNRSLVEYAFRAHRYGQSPTTAMKHGMQAAAMARQIMLPTKQIRGQMSDEQHAAFQKYLEAGPSHVTFGKVRKLMSATISMLGIKQHDFDQVMRWLEVEYTLGSGLIHGSLVTVLDVFRKGVGSRAERSDRSLHFRREDELIRTSTALLVLIAAIELYQKANLGGPALVESLSETFFREQSFITVWQHNTLLSMLGVRS